MALPEGMERAVGVKEDLYQCVDSPCKKYFRATAGTTRCPHCGSAKIYNCRAGGVAAVKAAQR